MHPTWHPPPLAIPFWCRTSENPPANTHAEILPLCLAVVATLGFLNYVCQEGDRKFESHLQQLCHAYYQSQMT